MFSRILFFFLVTILRDIYVRAQDSRCLREGEVFTTCGSPCKYSCDHPFEIKPKVCHMRCIEGCFCREGLYRDDFGNCVEPEQCPPKTNSFAEPVDLRCKLKGEVYEECGSTCPSTCDDFLDHKPRVCHLMCVQGCFCRQGLYRDRFGNCVRPEECPAKSNLCTGVGEIFDSCPSDCPSTCNNPEPTECMTLERPCEPGCVCQEGFVRDRFGKCVRPEKCVPDPRCSKNEVWSQCEFCYETCSSPGQICNMKKCLPGCYCRKGYVKADSSLSSPCIPKHECRNENDGYNAYNRNYQTIL